MTFPTYRGANGLGSGDAKAQSAPRICMLTSRNISKRAYQCALFEAQDVLLGTDSVDLIAPKPGRGFQFKHLWQRRLLYRDVTRQLIHQNPGLHRTSLRREYDLFVVVCQCYSDLLYINAIDNWKERCKTTVCWLDELWVADLPRFKYWLHFLKEFDHVFVGYKETAAELSRILNRTCHWLPGGVDAIRFSPYPSPGVRAVDVYSVGRRWSGIHHALLRTASSKEIFYIYDTVAGVANLEPHDYEHHRDLYANLAKRSQYFVVAPAKMDAPEETQGQVEIGYRYFEGAAAGAVMIGQRADCEAFRESFNWPDVVIEIQPDGSDVHDVLSRLRQEPERISTISRRNAAEALLHHDWLYRWKKIFRVSGIEPSPGMVAREQHMKDLAQLAESTVGNALVAEQLP